MSGFGTVAVETLTAGVDGTKVEASLAVGAVDVMADVGILEVERDIEEGGGGFDVVKSGVLDA